MISFWQAPSIWTNREPIYFRPPNNLFSNSNRISNGEYHIPLHGLNRHWTDDCCHSRRPTLVSYPVVQLDPNEKLVNVSGAGDSTTSGIIAGLLKGYNLTESIYNGLMAGKYALLTHKNVSSHLDAIGLDQLRSIIPAKQGQIKKTYLWIFFSSCFTCFVGFNK